MFLPAEADSAWRGVAVSCGAPPTPFPCDVEGRCPGASRCALDTGTCAAPLLDCEGVCTSLLVDSENCGACGQACASDEACIDGGCRVTGNTSCAFCLPGVACTNGACDCEGRGELCTVLCLDTSQSPVSCGECFAACPDSGSICRAGVCQCPQGQRACQGDCISVDLDAFNCGGCGVTCTGTDVCEAGTCQASCLRNAGDACADGVCWDLASDPAHCGAACDFCQEDAACVQGQCACPAGSVDCGGACVDVQHDALNCGACGVACDEGETCAAGACACTAGLTPCSGACADTRADAASCGACGVACAAGQSCSAGRCVTACPAGLTSCSGACVDVGRDARHCGGCETPCGVGNACVDGECAQTVPAVGCAACPCAACDVKRGWLCCAGASGVRCVDGLRCPP